MASALILLKNHNAPNSFLSTSSERACKGTCMAVQLPLHRALPAGPTRRASLPSRCTDCSVASPHATQTAVSERQSHRAQRGSGLNRSSTYNTENDGIGQYPVVTVVRNEQTSYKGEVAQSFTFTSPQVKWRRNYLVAII